MSFFKAPSWARSQAVKAEDTSERNIFSHSDNFLDIQKERIEREKRQKQKEREKEERRKAKQEEKRRSSSEKRKAKDEDGKGSLKKRRITAQDGAKLLASAGLGDSITISDSEDDAQAQLPVGRPPRTTRTKDDFSPSEPKGRLIAPLDVDEEEDLGFASIPSRPSRPQAQPPPEIEEDVDSDPEIAEIQRKARAAARLKEKAKAKAGLSATPELGSPGIDDSLENSHLPEPPQYDAAVQLLIESSIPGTAPLIVFRKLSQPLREVKKMWCKKQGFSDEFSKQVCLVYNGRKYFESSTVQRLGISADASGRVFLESDPTLEGVEKVHMQAMTEEMYEQLKEERERQARAEAGDYEAEPQEAEAGVDDEIAAPRQSIKLIVKAKGRKDYKVQVFNDTTFQKLLRAAKKVFGFAPEQDAYLELDGERLEPDDQVGHTDLEDLDQVQMVLVK